LKVAKEENAFGKYLTTMDDLAKMLQILSTAINKIKNIPVIHVNIMKHNVIFFSAISDLVSFK